MYAMHRKLTQNMLILHFIYGVHRTGYADIHRGCIVCTGVPKAAPMVPNFSPPKKHILPGVHSGTRTVDIRFGHMQLLWCGLSADSTPPARERYITSLIYGWNLFANSLFKLSGGHISNREA